MDLGSKGKTPRVGARLKALDEAVLMAVSDFSCNFFCILTSRFEQCEWFEDVVHLSEIPVFAVISR